MIHPDTYLKPTPKGLGIFAGRPFRRGEILWITDEMDARISLCDYAGLSELERRKVNVYSYLDSSNRIVMPWDEGKYVNHSCDPNSTSLTELDSISIALRDIAADEEIVEDYYSYCGHFESFQCRCGARHCRGYIHDGKTFEPGLRIPLREVAPLLLNLPQPLLAIRSEEKNRLLELLQMTHHGAGAAVSPGSL
ncbi:SET domain-containing protein [Larkinella soli]|uniref:SET domain-containing protein n=1 Tax=Larkinella soli TaxID=1770527 RepID=UPI000FFB28B1|nr:SET domain-containing protein-lysine N-methyltransferase [Larkinella soli]